MADLTHIHANQIRRKHLFMRLAAWLSGAGVIVCTMGGAWPGALALGAIWAGTGGTLAVNGKKWHSGWQGEARALRTLRNLPDDCTLLNQVRIPCQGSKTGWLEADFMAVTPRGVYIIEAKNHRGFIMVDGNGNWAVAGMDGVARPARNGARQALRQAAVAGQWLRDHGARAWIEPIVCATHPETIVSDSNGTHGVPVTKPETLLPLLLDDRWVHARAPTRLDAAARARIVQALCDMDGAVRHGVTTAQAVPKQGQANAGNARGEGAGKPAQRAAVKSRGADNHQDVGPGAPGARGGLRGNLAEATGGAREASGQVIPIGAGRARRPRP